MSKKIICASTNKEIGGYDGDLTVELILEGERRLLILSNFEINVTEDTDWEEVLYDASLEGDLDEQYPYISVAITSPFSDKNTVICLQKEASDSDEVETINLEDLPPGKHFFEELIVDCFSGKFRGDMEINFSEVEDQDDLLEVVSEILFDEYEWSFYYFAGCLAWITGEHTVEAIK